MGKNRDSESRIKNDAAQAERKRGLIGKSNVKSGSGTASARRPGTGLKRA